MSEIVPMNQFRFEIHGHMTPDGYASSKDYRCNYCDNCKQPTSAMNWVKS